MHRFPMYNAVGDDAFIVPKPGQRSGTFARTALFLKPRDDVGIVPYVFRLLWQILYFSM